MKSQLTILLILFTYFVSISQEILRGPYLQNLTPRSINILWRTSDSLVGNVWVGTNLDDLTVKYTNSIKTLNHNVKIDGLESG
jgi:acid phosphatase type 7